MGIQDRIGKNAPGPFIAVVKWLKVTNIGEGQKGLFVYVVFGINNIAEMA